MHAEIHQELTETMILSGFLEGRSLRALRVRHNLTDDEIYIHLQQYYRRRQKLPAVPEQDELQQWHLMSPESRAPCFPHVQCCISGLIEKLRQKDDELAAMNTALEETRNEISTLSARIRGTDDTYNCPCGHCQRSGT